MHHMLDARLQNRSNMKDRPWPFVVIFVWQFVAQFLYFVHSAQNFTNALIELQHKFTDYSAFYAFLRWFVVYCVRQCVYVLIFFSTAIQLPLLIIFVELGLVPFKLFSWCMKYLCVCVPFIYSMPQMISSDHWLKWQILLSSRKKRANIKHIHINVFTKHGRT